MSAGAGSCLEERLEELRLSTSAQHDSDTESEAVTSQSDAQSSGSEELNAFESYIRGMVGNGQMGVETLWSRDETPLKSPFFTDSH